MEGENTAGQPQTELASTEVITENGLVIIAFDATTFGNDDADRLVIAVEQDSTNTPTIDEDEYFAKMIAFPDTFFNNIIPTRQDRGGGVMELADGTQVQYEGFGGKKWRWQLTARFVKTAMINKLDELYDERPEFTYAQEIDRYPYRIYTCILENPEFRTAYSNDPFISTQAREYVSLGTINSYSAMGG